MNKKGFTLVELLAVIVVLGLVITITATKGFGAFDNTKKAITKQNLKAIKEAANVLAEQIDNCDDNIDKELWTDDGNLFNEEESPKNCDALKEKLIKKDDGTGCISVTVDYLITNQYLSENKDFETLKDKKVKLCKEEKKISINTNELENPDNKPNNTNKDDDSERNDSDEYNSCLKEKGLTGENVTNMNSDGEIPYCYDITGTNYILIYEGYINDKDNFQEYWGMSEYYNLLNDMLEMKELGKNCTAETCYSEDMADIIYNKAEYENFIKNATSNIKDKFKIYSKEEKYVFPWLYKYYNACLKNSNPDYNYDYPIDIYNNWYGFSDKENSFIKSKIDSTEGQVLFSINRIDYETKKGFTYTCKMDLNKKITNPNLGPTGCGDPVARCDYNIPSNISH